MAPNIQGSVNVQALPGWSRREETIDRILLRNIDDLISMGKDESLQIDHDREQDLFRDPVGLENCIKDFLSAFTVELEPAGISLGEAVTQIGLQVERTSQGPVYVRHDDRESHSPRHSEAARALMRAPVNWLQ